MLNKKINITKKEMTPAEMYFDKTKKVGAMFERKMSSMETGNLTNNAALLVTTFPDTWESKLEEVRRCAEMLGAIKDMDFTQSWELIQKCKHGGIIVTKVDEKENRKHEGDNDTQAEPF